MGCSVSRSPGIGIKEEATSDKIFLTEVPYEREIAGSVCRNWEQIQ